MPIPRIIALCGHPGSGKSTACELLSGLYGHEINDDGKPLREIAKAYLGLTHEQVYTQAGKLEMTVLNGRTWQVRGILGEIGNAFDEKFGGEVIPLMSSRLMDPNKRYVTGSVRREQGVFWRELGAMVIEVVNPIAPPSPFEFDTFNPAPVHQVVLNDAQSLGLTGQKALARFEAALLAAVRTWS